MSVIHPATLAYALAAAATLAGAAFGTEPAAGDLCSLHTSPDRRSTASSACMTCHDGSKAPDARNGHRFDVEYVTFGKQLRNNPEQFNAKVVLGSGNTVTCLTCHDPASQLVYHLAGPTDGLPAQRLCVACHLFD